MILKESTSEIGLIYSGKSVPSTAHPRKNEDAIFVDTRDNFACVLDGAGGLKDARKASQTAKALISNQFRLLPTPKFQEELPTDDEIRAVYSPLNQLLQNASLMIENLTNQGGTTATLVRFIKTESAFVYAFIANVGDSRAYHYSPSTQTLNLITRDQNLILAYETPEDYQAISARLDEVSTAEELAKLSVPDKEYFDSRQTVTSLLGYEPLRPANYHLSLNSGDLIVITSDGIHDNLTGSEIQSIVNLRPRRLASSLVSEALKRSQDIDHLRAKPDDMSAVVVRVG